MRKKIILISTLLIITLLISGCFKSNTKLIKEDGYTIQVTDDFKKREIENFDTYYENEKVGFTSLKESFEDLAIVDLNEDSLLSDYGKSVAANNDSLETFKESKDGKYMYANYEATASGKDFFYYSVIKKGTDGFWLFNFFCLKSDKNEQLSNIEKWASSIEVE